MSFATYFARKIAFSKDKEKSLSSTIIGIGRLSVALGVIICLLTLSIGLASKGLIRDKIENFSGPISIKSVRSNSSYNSSPLSSENFDINKIKSIPGVSGIQKFASVSGILRTKENFAGIVFRGVGKDFKPEKFDNFLVDGSCPTFTEKGYSMQILLPEKIASELKLKAKDSIVAIFSTEEKVPIYRKFEVAGIFRTDIKMIDDLYIIGDINHVRKILKMKPEEVGGYDIFLTNFEDSKKIGPTIEQNIGYKNYAEYASDKYPQVMDMFGIFNNNISLIVSLMLIVVAINIIIVFLILIIERTQSIGVLKTLGAPNSNVRKIFISYTLLIMIPGLLLGNAIAIILLIIQKFTGLVRLNPDNYYISTVPVSLNPLMIIGVSLGILVISAIAMLLPSHYITKISPAKSITYQ